MYHLNIFPYISMNLRLIGSWRWKKALLVGQFLLIPLNGPPGSALVAMICRAVCYFCPVTLDFEKKKKLKGVIGTICPCFLFGKNADFLGSGTLAGSCMTHFILWGLVNSLCCLFSGGILAFFPGAMVACYACGYRKALRVKYNLQEAPCGDLMTHLFCHPCAICQEYREIRERSDGSTTLTITNATAPPIQSMDLPEK